MDNSSWIATPVMEAARTRATGAGVPAFQGAARVELFPERSVAVPFQALGVWWSGEDTWPASGRPPVQVTLGAAPVYSTRSRGQVVTFGLQVLVLLIVLVYAVAAHLFLLVCYKVPAREALGLYVAEPPVHGRA